MFVRTSSILHILNIFTYSLPLWHNSPKNCYNIKMNCLMVPAILCSSFFKPSLSCVVYVFITFIITAGNICSTEQSKFCFYLKNVHLEYMWNKMKHHEYMWLSAWGRERSQAFYMSNCFPLQSKFNMQIITNILSRNVQLLSKNSKLTLKYHHFVSNFKLSSEPPLQESQIVTAKYHKNDYFLVIRYRVSRFPQ